MYATDNLSSAAAPLIDVDVSFSAAQLQFARLQGQRLEIAKTVGDLTDQVAKAKARLQCAAEVAAVFQEMQHRAHDRAVGSLESLLSAIMQDVLPNEGQIKLDLDMVGNAATLDIRLQKNGYVTDVMEDNGGGVTNVVSAGLYYAALSRTENRKFLVLDEPDCWLKAEHVPAFMKVVTEVGRQNATQTVLVSHHPPQYFGEDVARVELTRDAAGRIHATVLHEGAGAWLDDTTPGIRVIELCNFKAHQHTFIPLFSGATALLGGVNFGKSAALRACIRAVAYNESTDQCIHHGQDSARIVIHLEHNQKLVWTRVPKRNPVVFYELYKDDVLVIDGRPPARNVVPEWVADVLGVRRVDGLDLQVSNQKTPVFLLERSPEVRAKVLSVGAESSQLASLVARYDELKRSDRAAVRNGESQLTGLIKKLSAADALDQAETTLTRLEEQHAWLEQNTQGYVALDRLGDQQSTIRASIEDAERRVAASADLPAAPTLLDTTPLERLVERVASARPIADIGIRWAPVAVPELHCMDSIHEIGRRIAKSKKIAALHALVPAQLPAPPVLQDPGTVETIIQRIAASTERLQQAQADMQASDAEWSREHAAFDELLNSLGHRCPLCNSHLPTPSEALC